MKLWPFKSKPRPTGDNCIRCGEPLYWPAVIFCSECLAELEKPAILRRISVEKDGEQKLGSSLPG